MDRGLSKWVTVFALVLVVVGQTALAQAQQARSKLDEVLACGYVIVGTSSEAPPFGFIDGHLLRHKRSGFRA